MAKRKNRPQNQTESNEPSKEEEIEKEPDDVKQDQETTQEVQFEANVDVDTAVAYAIKEELKGLDELVSKLVSENINYEEITTSVLQHVEAKKPEGGEAPKWYRLDAEKCYQQCLDRALHIVTTGQTHTYMSQARNCKSIMNQAISLANSMFEALAEEFQIAS